MMSSLHLWNDNRIFFKEAASLAKKYNVELHGVGDFHYKQEKGVHIYGLPRLKKRFLRPVNWWRLLLRAVRSKARVYHFHDPELIPLGIILKLLKRKVIYDIHEDYPDAILHKGWIPGFMRKAVATIYNVIEKKCCSFFDALIFAELTYKDSFTSVNVLQEDILNYPLLLARATHKYTRRPRVTTLIYAGTISEIRGAVQMVQALHLLVQAGEDVRMLLVGPIYTPGLKDRLQKMVAEYGLQDRFTLTGRVSPAHLYDYHEMADIGLALLHPVENNLKSLVTKLFEYMSAGLPMVVSNFPRWEKLFQDVEAGVLVNPYDPEAIATKIKYLIDHPQVRWAMGARGHQAYLERYNWSSEEKKLFNLYAKLFKEEGVEHAHLV